MNRRTILSIILICAVVGVFIVIQQTEKATKRILMQQRATEEAHRLAFEAQKVLLAAEQESTALQTKINGLTVQANTFLNDSKFQEAIDTAKAILSQDADNTEAKSILETAMAKLRDFTIQQAGSLQEDGKKTLEGLTTSLKEAATQ